MAKRKKPSNADKIGRAWLMGAKPPTAEEWIIARFVAEWIDDLTMEPRILVKGYRSPPAQDDDDIGEVLASRIRRFALELRVCDSFWMSSEVLGDALDIVNWDFVAMVFMDWEKKKGKGEKRKAKAKSRAA